MSGINLRVGTELQVAAAPYVDLSGAILPAKKVLVVFGTRPEAIKLAPVILALRGRPKAFDTRVCLTGQHRDMVYQFVDYFGLSADYDLKLMQEGQTLPDLTARLLASLDGVVRDYEPDVILVQGDTTTAFAGSLAGFYRRVSVGHVEAGLRTAHKYAPFPEELNRRMVGVIADHHFAPTRRAEQALLNEGVPASRIVVTGNTVIDALLHTLSRIQQTPPDMGNLRELIDSDRPLVLITGHRRETFGGGFYKICIAIRTLAKHLGHIAFVYPVHLNPNVQRPVYEMLSDLPNVYLVPPLGYVQFVRLLSRCRLVLTDSGGIQEEAPTLDKPVLVMREVTERMEAVEAGAARLVGTDPELIFSESVHLLTNREAWSAMSAAVNPFGDGRAAERIAIYLQDLP